MDADRGELGKCGQLVVVGQSQLEARGANPQPDEREMAGQHEASIDTPSTDLPWIHTVTTPAVRVCRRVPR
ncbi:hypothetical protein GCM10009676_30280 [Prauserella halophila]|uniref:Uncharacterized protein n=1 Tax=Prauserella halophila TaxID=185641 RepID=A0ABN1WCS2_9PSEU